MLLYWNREFNTCFSNTAHTNYSNLYKDSIRISVCQAVVYSYQLISCNFECQSPVLRWDVVQSLSCRSASNIKADKLCVGGVWVEQQISFGHGNISKYLKLRRVTSWTRLTNLLTSVCFHSRCQPEPCLLIHKLHWFLG